MGKLEPWDEVQEGPPDKRRVFTVRTDLVRSRKTGRVHPVDRLLVSPWVNVVAFTAAEEMIFVRQWRFGARAFTLELPAGIVEPDEAPLAAGLRELREETGYAPARGVAPRIIGTALPNPAVMANQASTVLVPHAVVAGPQELDPMEEVEVVLVPAREVEDRVRRGELCSALVLVALSWWRLAS